MAEFTTEQLAAAKAAKSPEELITMAKDAGIEMTLEQVEQFLHSTSGELSEEEIAKVTGGSSGTTPDPLSTPIEQEAYAEGYTKFVGQCFYCYANTLYRDPTPYQPIPPDGYEHFRSKCFSCGKTVDSTLKIN